MVTSCRRGMKRKVNRVGQNTLTVSLPAKWAQKNDVSPGEEIDVLEDGSSLLISKGASTKRAVKVVLNADNLNKMVINRHIHEFYLRGVEEIAIKFTKDKSSDYKNKGQVDVVAHVKKIVERFIGMEMVSHTSGKIILQSFMSHEETSKIDIIQKRVYFLIKELFDEFLKAMEDDFKKFDLHMYDYHDNIAKFTYYYLRLLNFSEIEGEKKLRLFSLFMIIDKVIDKIRHASERTAQMKKITPKIKRYLSDMFLIFTEQFEMLNRQDYALQEMDSLIKRRYLLLEKIDSERFNDEEYKVISECRLLLDTQVDFCETFIAINIDKYIF